MLPTTYSSCVPLPFNIDKWGAAWAAQENMHLASQKSYPHHANCKPPSVGVSDQGVGVQV